MRVVIAIPTYNCAPQLHRVLSALAEESVEVFEIWLVDNGSSDQTVDVALEFKTQLKNLRIFINSTNVSLGGTHKIVFEKARAEEISHVLILHGDDQASVKDIASLIRQSQTNGGLTVLGSRFMRGSARQGYSARRVVGNVILNAIYSIATRRVLSDLGSGLNIFRIEDLAPDSYLQFGNSLSFNYELILELVRSDVPFSYYPIVWRDTDQVSNARNFRIFFSALRILTDWLLSDSVIRETNEIHQLPQWKEVGN